MDHMLFGTPVERPTAEMPIIIPGQRVNKTPLRLLVAHPLAGKHALLVGINYAPEPTGIAPYTTGMAEHLAKHAGRVTMLTGMPHYPNWTLNRADRWVLRSSKELALGNGNGLTLRRARHYVPRSQSAITRAWYEASFLANASSTRFRHRPDLVIGVTPSLSGAVTGARLARRHGSKLLIVVQDLMAKAATQSGIRGGDYAARTTAAIERYALTKADRVAIVSEAFRDQLHEYGVADEKISVLPNWTHISPTQLSQSQCRRDLGWPIDPFTVVHTGNMGLKQDLGNMVEAARLCQNVPGIHFVIVGDGSQRAEVETQGADVQNLTFVDPLHGDEYPKALAAADLLVVNERPGVGDMSLPSKLTSYLSTGRPVLAAVAPDGATALELKNTGGAALLVPPGGPAAFVAAVLALRLDPARRTRMAVAGREYAEATLGEKAAASRLDDLIEECLNTP
jgi:putative colanic acid biosynthesis glycosyltransferase WcaI